MHQKKEKMKATTYEESFVLRTPKLQMAGWTDGKNDSVSVLKLYHVICDLQSWNFKMLMNYFSAENYSLHGTFILFLLPWFIVLRVTST